MSLALYNSLFTNTYFLNPQINVKEITQNILIVLAIQNTILAQIRLTIYKIVMMMSFDGYGLWDFTDFATDLFVALLKKSTEHHLSCFPEKDTALKAFRFPLYTSALFPTCVINIHPRTYIHYGIMGSACAAHDRLACPGCCRRVSRRSVVLLTCQTLLLRHHQLHVSKAAVDVFIPVFTWV